MKALINETPVTNKQIYLFLVTNLFLFKKLNILKKYEIFFDRKQDSIKINVFDKKGNDLVNQFIGTNIINNFDANLHVEFHIN